MSKTSVAKRVATSALYLFTLLTWTALSSAHAEAAADASARANAEPPANVAPVSAESTGSPVETVERLHVSLIEAMKDAAYDGRLQTLTEAIPSSYDIGFMARMAVGSRAWKALPEADRDRWGETFGRLVAANYAGRFKGWSGHTFVTLGEEPASRETVLVKTKLVVPGDEDVLLNYRLREIDGEWRIIDVFLNGTVSEVALRRSEYGSVLKKSGFEKLAQVVEEKIEELAADG